VFSCEDQLHPCNLFRESMYCHTQFGVLQFLISSTSGVSTTNEEPSESQVFDDNPKIDIKTTHGRVDSATFIVRDEDHTLGNALRYLLMKDPDVEFAGYSIPHPSDAIMNIRVQTYRGKPAVEVLRKALGTLKDICDHVEQVYRDEVSLHSNEENMEQMQI